MDDVREREREKANSTERKKEGERKGESMMAIRVEEMARLKGMMGMGADEAGSG